MSGAVVQGLDGLGPGPSTVGIGFFDGVHRGHQAIVGRAVAEARRLGIRSLVVTFDRHPLEVVRPGAAPPLLMGHARRAATLAALGVDAVVVLPFDDGLRALAPDAFVTKVLAGTVQARHVVVGENFRFGHRAAGDAATLVQEGAVHGFGAEAVPLVHHDGAPVSSTRIREAVAAGAMAAAATMLGRPHLLEGLVVHGDRRGRELGFPTANLADAPGIAVPAPGIYVATARADDVRRDALVSVGYRPTFGGTDLRVEAYLLDFDGDLYGRHLELAVRHRLRGEVRFDGAAALVAQMRQDERDARQWLQHG